MSIFDKIFHREQGKQTEPKNHTQQGGQAGDDKSFVTPLGKFSYVYAPDCNPPEFGYESDIQWYDVPEDAVARAEYFPVGCYIDCNTPDTKDAGICLDRLTRLFEDRVWTDRRVKQAVADHFADENGMVKNGNGEMISRDECTAEMEITFIGIYRDQTTCYTIDPGMGLDIDGKLHVTFRDADEAVFQTDEEFYGFRL